MINTARHGIKELDSSELSTLSQLANLNTNADLIDKAIDHWGTATWSGNILNVTSEIPSQELYTGLSVSFMLTATNPESATIKLDSLDEKSLLNSTGSVMSAGLLTAGQIYTVTYDGIAFRINNVAHATSADSAASATNADTVDGMHAADFATAAQGTKADAALPAASYTVADILAKIETVDGAGSGLDADTIDGLDSTAFATAAQGAKAEAALPAASYTAADILAKIETVDGNGSGLDADTIDGLDSTAFATAAQGAKADAALPMSGYTAADILSKIKTVDGAGSGLDADTLDGLESTAFATAAQGAKADAALPAAKYTAADLLSKIETVDGAGSGLDADTLDGFDSTAFASTDSLTAHLSDSKFQTAGGTATAITITTATLSDGYAKTFIASAGNSGTATTINGLPLYKPNTTTAPTLVAGKAYTVWYSSTGSCFFLKASAEGTATAADVLAGKTFSNDSDTGITGMLDLSNLTPGNIVSGVTIAGVTGTVINANKCSVGNQLQLHKINGGYYDPGSNLSVVAQAQMLLSGNVRIVWGLTPYYGSEFTIPAQIYKNGVAFGPLHNIKSSGLSEFTEDFDCTAGDVFQIGFKYPIILGDFYIYTSTPATAT